LSPAIIETHETDSTTEVRKTVIEKARSYYRGFDGFSLDDENPAKFTVTIDGEDTKCDITNLMGYLTLCSVEEGKVEIDKYVRILRLEIEPNEENLTAIIRTADYITNYTSETMSIVSEFLVGELSLIYAVENADMVMPLSQEDRMEKSDQELRAIALANIKKWLPEVNCEEALSPILLYNVKGNSLAIGSMILLDEFWTDVTEAVSSDVYFALPRRDQLFIVDAKVPQAVSAMREIIAATFEDGFALLSDKLFRRRNNKLEMVVN
jgi:uncharacterized protein YtpQ (UPF0354 family)